MTSASATTGIASRTAPVDVVLGAVATAVEQGRPVVLATVLRRHGSTPATPGQKLALIGDGEALGTVGGGALEQDVIVQMLHAQQTGAREPFVREINLHAAYGMSCGGSVEILIEPLSVGHRVLVVGAGHVGSAVAPLLVQVGFRVVLCDTRDAVLAMGGAQRSSSVATFVAEHDDPRVRAALGGEVRDAAAVVMTHDHELDDRALQWALGEGFGFVGGVGSARKSARLRARWAEVGLAEADIQRMRMPLGVDIGARSPAEIAVAIAGELVAWRAGLVAAAGGGSAGGRVTGSSP